MAMINRIFICLLAFTFLFTLSVYSDPDPGLFPDDLFTPPPAMSPEIYTYFSPPPPPPAPADSPSTDCSPSPPPPPPPPAGSPPASPPPESSPDVKIPMPIKLTPPGGRVSSGKKAGIGIGVTAAVCAVLFGGLLLYKKLSVPKGLPHSSYKPHATDQSGHDNIDSSPSKGFATTSPTTHVSFNIVMPSFGSVPAFSHSTTVSSSQEVVGMDDKNIKEIVGKSTIADNSGDVAIRAVTGATLKV